MIQMNRPKDKDMYNDVKKTRRKYENMNFQQHFQKDTKTEQER